MDSGKNPYAVKYDLTNCDKEPIHIIRLVQSHACLIACNLSNYSILQVSDNTAAIIGYTPDDLLATTLDQVLDKVTLGLIKEGITNGFTTINPIRAAFTNLSTATFYNLIAHVNLNGLLIIEIEPIGNNISTSTFQYLLSHAIQKVQQASIESLFEVTAEEIKKITGYDRVMIYKFDENYNGSVIAEAKEASLDAFLGLHYPATDIPKQARDLFLKNKTRILADVHSEPAVVIPILTPTTKVSLDMTHSIARGVSPIHLEYLKNMKVGATLSIAITINDQLWGLIACHHRTKKYIDYSVRTTCQFIGQILSGHLALQSANEYRTSVLKSNIIRSTLFEQMSADYNILKGLTAEKDSILDLVDCTGAVVITENKISTLGQTPNKLAIQKLANWLESRTNKAVFSTNELPNIYPPAMEFKEQAVGLMAIKFAVNPNEYILWFRPEVVQEVFWGGNPNKTVVKKEVGQRISPRKSFAKWKSLVQNTARPWDKYELNAAIELRNDIKEFIIQKFNEIRQLNQQMAAAYKELETFSYSVSHDLRAPLRNIDGFAQILKEDYGEKLDEYGIEVLNTIIDSTSRMNVLINDILNFSRLGRTAMIFNEIDANELMVRLEKNLRENPNYQTKLSIPKKLPTIYGDESLLTQLFTNLLSNAYKYTEKESQPIIEVTSSNEKEYTIIAIKDNGIGFDMKYASKIFGVFNRLVSEMEFEGTGVGLAIVHRITQRHGGKVWVESTPDLGATFFVKLPKKAYSVTQFEQMD